MLGGVGGHKSRKKLTERLAKNLEKAKLYPQDVPAGQDNWATLLHEARFLPGLTCKQTEVWLAARRHIGLKGLEPVSKYDSEGLGLSGRINVPSGPCYTIQGLKNCLSRCWHQGH